MAGGSVGFVTYRYYPLGIAFTPVPHTQGLIPTGGRDGSQSSSSSNSSTSGGKRSMKRPIRSEARLYRWVLDFLGLQRIIHRNFETW